MVSSLSILLGLLSQLAFGAMLPIGPATPGVPDHLKDGWQFSSGCKTNRSWAKIEGSAQVKSFLGGMAQTVKQTIPVYSCFRSQESQDEILKREKCAPRFGTVECSGRIAANKSEHTVGVAADFQVQTSIPPNSPHSVRDGEVVRYCALLDRLRKSHAGGRGGITMYGVGDDSVAFMHYDSKGDWCNWGGCEKIGTRVVLGEGHCKRKKFAEKEARLEQALGAARMLRAQNDIKRLEMELKRLRADCPPGDAKCRDSFKD